MIAAPDKLYTSSRIRVWRECHRKAFFKYTLLIRTPQTPQMAFGTWLHVALEHWYRAWELGDLDGRLPVAFKAIDAIECDDVERAKLRALVAAYHARWHAEPWEVLGVEVEFRYYLGDIQLGGKIDAIVRETTTGRILLIEHKSTRTDASPGSVYWDRLAVDTQVSVYIDGAKYGLGYDVAGCVYDVLKVPQHEPQAGVRDEERAAKMTQGTGCSACGGRAKGPAEKGRGYLVVTFGSVVEQPPCDKCAGTGWRCDKDGVPQAPRLRAGVREHDETIEEFEERIVNAIAEHPDDYLQRGVIVRLDSELPKTRQELLDTIAEMRLLEEAGLHAPNHSNCAVGRNMCGFYAACSGRESIDNEYVFHRGESAHPELDVVAA